MRASVCAGYGSPENIRIEEVPQPEPKPDEVLVRVRATTVSSADDRILRASPPVIRAAYGLRRPRRNVFGSAFAGIVESVGADVTSFAAGDRVFATTDTKLGTHAEYVAIAADDLIFRVPEGIDLRHAACVPFGFSTALHFLKKAKVGKGDRMLVIGAGALGTATVQLAIDLSARADVVCAAEDIALVKSLGAGEALDYRTSGYSDYGSDFDVIFDTLGVLPFRQAKRLLADGGRYVSSVHISPLRVLGALVLSMTSNKKAGGGMSSEKREDLEFLSGLLADGTIDPVVGHEFPFDRIARAYELMRSGHKTGNIVINIESTDGPDADSP